LIACIDMGDTEDLWNSNEDHRFNQELLRGQSMRDKMWGEVGEWFRMVSGVRHVGLCAVAFDSCNSG